MGLKSKLSRKKVLYPHFIYTWALKARLVWCVTMPECQAVLLVCIGGHDVKKLYQHHNESKLSRHVTYSLLRNTYKICTYFYYKCCPFSSSVFVKCFCLVIRLTSFVKDIGSFHFILFLRLVFAHLHLNFPFLPALPHSPTKEMPLCKK